mmetsp:Transcript_74205/g.147022  ORF Transcript_74205/g.147022 Transcript_74205/m.147022 type:complete len:218 (-) Transcript_74205:83-736(-)
MHNPPQNFCKVKWEELSAIDVQHQAHRSSKADRTDEGFACEGNFFSAPSLVSDTSKIWSCLNVSFEYRFHRPWARRQVGRGNDTRAEAAGAIQRPVCQVRDSLHYFRLADTTVMLFAIYSVEFIALRIDATFGVHCRYYLVPTVDICGELLSKILRWNAPLMMLDPMFHGFAPHEKVVVCINDGKFRLEHILDVLRVPVRLRPHFMGPHSRVPCWVG